MIVIKIAEIAGTFAENKDKARDIRVATIIPALEKKQQIILDFGGVEGVTQSFIHALISDALRKFGDEALDLISFKSCEPTVKKIIEIVISYMQDS